MDAHISFLPISLKGQLRTRTTRRIAPAYGSPACLETTTHKRMSDPRYVARIIESGYSDGRRIRSTLLIEKASGKTVDYLHLVSADQGKTWKYHGSPASNAATR